MNSYDLTRISRNRFAHRSHSDHCNGYFQLCPRWAFDSSKVQCSKRGAKAHRRTIYVSKRILKAYKITWNYLFDLLILFKITPPAGHSLWLIDFKIVEYGKSLIFLNPYPWILGKNPKRGTVTERVLRKKNPERSVVPFSRKRARWWSQKFTDKG